MHRSIRAGVKRLLNVCPSWTAKLEYSHQQFSRFNERPVEFAFLFRAFAQIYPQRVLDVGTGTTALPHLLRNCGSLVTATDNIRDYWPSGMSNRHYHVVDDDICNTRLEGGFDLVTCISVLEHIEDAGAAVRNMFALLKPGGHIVASFPYCERSYVRNVYDLPGSSYGQGSAYITQAFSRTEIDHWMKSNNGEIVDQEYWRFWDGEYWTVGNQVVPPSQVTLDDRHQLTCILAKKL